MATESAFLFEVSAPPLAGDPVTEPRGKRVRLKRTIQDLRLVEGVVAVDESVNCGDLDELRSRLIARFDQNNQETKLRYARFVIANFFRDGLDRTARKTWMAYQDEKILADVLRYLYLQHEPVMGACVVQDPHVPRRFFASRDGPVGRPGQPDARVRGTEASRRCLESHHATSPRRRPTPPSRTNQESRRNAV